MTLSAAMRGLRKAEKAYHHATSALAKAESESARKRHARRAQQAARHMADLRRDVSRLELVTRDIWEREAA